jgi:hypothetical protein
MNKVLLATITTAALALAACTADEAAAAELTGEVSLDVTQNAADKIVATPEIELGIEGEMGVGSIGLIVDNADDTVKLDSYSLGVKVGEAVVSFGDQGDLMEAFEGSTEAVGGQTLTDLNDEGESIKIQTGNVGVMVGLEDIGTDVTDIKNIQVGANAEMGAVALAAAVNWDQASEDITVGVNAQMDYQAVNLSGTVTYTEAVTGYELSAGYGDFAAFINGDDTDMTQNIGGGLYKSMANGMSFYAEAGYNLDAEEITPAAGVSFKF